jgi:hypothetical protein
MPHFAAHVLTRTGDYMAYLEAESIEAAEAEVTKEPGHRIGTDGKGEPEIWEREGRGLGYTVVVGNYRYGAGPDLATAKQRFRARGGRLSDGYAVLVFDEDTDFCGIDNMGRTMTMPRDYDTSKPSKAPEVTQVAPRGH